jgi:hypothetical protein
MNSELLEEVLCSDEDLSELYVQTDKRVTEFLSRQTPNVEQANFRFPEKDKNTILQLCLISWFLPEIPRILLQENLKELRTPEFEVEKISLLTSKDWAVLTFSRKLSERDFFGNFLPNLRKRLRRVRFSVLYYSKAKRTIRRRGYRDKGTLRSSDHWRESFDWTFTAQQNQIEEDRDFKEAILLWNRRILLGHVKETRRETGC